MDAEPRGPAALVSIAAAVRVLTEAAARGVTAVEVQVAIQAEEPAVIVAEEPADSRAEESVGVEERVALQVGSVEAFAEGGVAGTVEPDGPGAAAVEQAWSPVAQVALEVVRVCCQAVLVESAVELGEPQVELASSAAGRGERVLSVADCLVARVWFRVELAGQSRRVLCLAALAELRVGFGRGDWVRLRDWDEQCPAGQLWDAVLLRPQAGLC